MLVLYQPYRVNLSEFHTIGTTADAHQTLVTHITHPHTHRHRQSATVDHHQHTRPCLTLRFIHLSHPSVCVQSWCQHVKGCTKVCVCSSNALGHLIRGSGISRRTGGHAIHSDRLKKGPTHTHTHAQHKAYTNTLSALLAESIRNCSE